MITRNSAGLYPWSKDLEASSDVRLREREGFAMLLGWLEKFIAGSGLSPGREACERFGKEQIRAIADIQIRLVATRLQDQDIRLEVSLEAMDLLGQAGFDPVYGARPLKRAIQTQLETPLAREILSGSFATGDTIYVEAAKNGLVFSKTGNTVNGPVLH